MLYLTLSEEDDWLANLLRVLQQSQEGSVKFLRSQVGYQSFVSLCPDVATQEEVDFGAGRRDVWLQEDREQPDEEQCKTNNNFGSKLG